MAEKITITITGGEISVTGAPSTQPQPETSHYAGDGIFSVDRIAPLNEGENRWRGTIAKKPNEYPVTVVIPHFGAPDLIWYVTNLYRFQTVKPYFIIVDTGSSPYDAAHLESFREDDLEIHYIRSHSYTHSSNPVAIANDLGLMLCQSPYIYFTHLDCFPRRKNLLQDLMEMCNEQTPVVGYEMSSRSNITDEWEGMVGHVMMMCYKPTLKNINATWDLDRAALDMKGLPAHGWPDTETHINRIFRLNGITPLLIGHEINGQRQVDDNIDHCRSYTATQIYAKTIHKVNESWIKAALVEAKGRIDAWRLG